MPPLADVLEESGRILDYAEKSGVVLRLVGGVAVRFTSPSSTKDQLRRAYRDADFVGKSSQTRELKSAFRTLGYSPREAFNAMQGGRRLVFNDFENNRRVDIFQDYFEMCHRFDLRRRLELRSDTLPLVDLLETKLQIVQMNEKDYRDIIALLVDHELASEEDSDRIDESHIRGQCSDNWGIYRTFSRSLENVIGNLDAYHLDETDRSAAEKRAQSLLEGIQQVPKTIRWKVRAKVGERAQWYESPEADVAVVDSRF